MPTIRVLVLLACCASPAAALQDAILTFHGNDSSGQLGFCVDGGADIDGDGHADILVSAWGEGQQGTGSVYVYSGADGHVIHDFHGQAPNDLFGVSAAFAGDSDADGVADIIVAARVPGSSESYFRVFSGADGHVFFTVYTQPVPGTLPTFESVDGIGDVNADGHDDFVVSMDPNDVGTPTNLQVHSGADGSSIYTIVGAGDASGPVRGAGDLDDDGVPDLVLGDQYHAITIVSGGSTNKWFVGAVRTFSGVDGSLLHEWVGDGRNDRFGFAVDGIGDVDADGYGDVVGGAIQWLGLDFPGYAQVLSGKDGSVIHEWNGTGHGADLGSAISRAGDLDGDGHEDLLVGDYGSNFSSVHDGSVRVLSGRDFSLLFEFFGHSGPFASTTTLSVLGITVGSAGDVDADGRSDVIIAAPNDSSTVSLGGSVWVFAGRDFAWHETPPPSGVETVAPELSAFGALEAGNTVALLLTEAEPFQACWIVAGLSQAPTPFLGGVLVPTPDVIAGPIALNPAGGFLLSSEAPALPPGTTICLQAWSVSPAPSGFAGSNAIEATAD